MLKAVASSEYAPRFFRASCLAALAIGFGSIACGGKGGSSDPKVTVGADDDEVNDDEGEVAAPGVTPAGAETGCGCATSTSLQALSCASEGGGVIHDADQLDVTPSGDVAVFTLCHTTDSDPEQHCRAFRWTRAGGTEALVGEGYHRGLADDGSVLVVPSEDEYPGARLLLVGSDGKRTPVPLDDNAHFSADGRYVVGFVPLPSNPIGTAEGLSEQANRNPLARWSLAGGLEPIAEVPDGLYDSTVFNVSADAAVIVGAAYDTSDENLQRAPLLYTTDQGLQQLEGSPNGRDRVLAFVSRDGSAFAGIAKSHVSFDELGETFYATASGGVRSVATADPVAGFSFHQELSDDGLVLAGTGWVPDVARDRLYRWTAEGLTWLGPSDAASRLADMTADGTLVLGTLVDTEQGFIARPGETRNLNDLLEGTSVDSTGWELKAPLRISDDGKVVFGSALCGGVPTVYRWVLPE